MMDLIYCPLCEANAKEPAFRSLERFFFQCSSCGLLFVNPKQHLSSSEEKLRYEQHNNDIEDPRYQEFVRPLFNEITAQFSSDKRGLDFGAGTGPVLTHLLRRAGYSVSLYDPFFWPDKTLLESSYDFVFATEVVEHFSQPKREFSLLHKITREGLFLMTLLYTDKTDLSSWYYLRDPTHVCAYSEKTLLWIKQFFGYSKLEIKNPRVIYFRK